MTEPGVPSGALDLARAFRAGGTTARDTVEDLLSRIEAHDPALGAFQAVYAEDARAAAGAADRAMGSGHRVGPFHGIPFAVKDVIDVAGRVTTAGSLTRPGRPAAGSATVAGRLLAAGGILLGKTKTIEFSMGGWGTNRHFGTPRNPWDPSRHRVAGGSSSGSAAAVAAGMVPAALGTDTGGSIRTPAAWCGAVGLKTTHGVLPMDGIVPTAHSLDTVGPIVRSVADAAFLLDVMAGRGPAGLDRHLDPDAPPALPGLRLGALPRDAREGMDDAVLDLYDAALERLRSLGAGIEVFSPPLSYADMARANRLIATSEAYAHHGAPMEDPRAPVDEDVRRLILPGRNVPAHEYIAALLRRAEDIEAFLTRMRGFAALATPTLGVAAAPLEEVKPRDYPAGFTRPVNYLGMCAVSVPMGLTPERLPAGLQIVARAGEEATALRVAAAYERARGPFPHPPAFAPPP